MSSVKPESPEPRGSWRSIRQEVKSVAMSRQGRRRRLIAWSKMVGLCALVGGAVWGLYSVIHSWETDRVALTTAVHSEPVREIAVITDGVLTKQWATETMALPRKVSLMALELPQLRDRLLASGQARVAVLTRSFPDTLVVTLQERTPVARIYDNAFDSRELLVAKDGTVYRGTNYDKELLASLPVLEGVELKKQGNGYALIAGMDEISALLSTAQLQAPHLYREWLMVSLAKFDKAGEIIVQTKRIPQVRFSRKLDFFKQIARLDYIIDAMTMLPEPVFKTVNLTIENQTPVELEQTPDQIAAGAAGAAVNSPSKAPQRKGKRDLQ